MTFFLLVGRAACYGLAPSFQHPLPIIGMKHALPTLALQFFLRETEVGPPSRIAEIQRAIRWAAPDLLRDCVDHEPQAIFTFPQGLFCPLTLDYLISQCLVERFKL